MSVRFLRWIIFSVFLSLVPLATLWLVNFAVVGRDSSFSALLSRGELMLIAAVLCATAIGELISVDVFHKRLLMFFGGMSVLIMLASSFLFPFFAYPELVSGKLDVDFVVSSSLYVYAAAVFCSGVCIYKSE